MHRFQVRAFARSANLATEYNQLPGHADLKRVLKDLCPSFPGYRLVFELRRIRERGSAAGTFDRDQAPPDSPRRS